MKTSIPKSKPREISYRCYKNFNQPAFNRELQTISDSNSYDTFEEQFLEALDRHAPLKSKIVLANDKPFITKEIRKVMIKTANLQRKFWSQSCRIQRGA